MTYQHVNHLQRNKDETERTVTTGNQSKALKTYSELCTETLTTEHTLFKFQQGHCYTKHHK